MNRISYAINEMQARLEEKAKTDPDVFAKLSPTAQFSFEDLVSLQELKSAAHAIGVLTAEEAQSIYMLLKGGARPEQANGLPLAHRIVLTQLHLELLKAKLATRSQAVA